MSLHIIHAPSMPAQPWRNGGGQTRELWAWPPGPHNNTDWQVRVSRADIEADGPFSAFHGVQRWFAVLHGAGVQLHWPDSNAQSHSQSRCTLRPTDAPCHFDGGSAPGCTLLDGPTQDLNLMARSTDQRLACMERVAAHTPWPTRWAMQGLYTCTPGVWSDGTRQQALQAHTLLWDDAVQVHPTRTTATPSVAWHFVPDHPEPLLAAWWLGFTPQTSP
jgi:environmental stress-induced protein Ves